LQIKSRIQFKKKLRGDQEKYMIPLLAETNLLLFMLSIQKKTLLLTLPGIFFLLCCSHENFIKEVDLSGLMPDRKNGMTIEQSQQQARRFFDQVTINTVGKQIPSIQVYNKNDKPIDLREVIDRKTVLIASDVHCGFGTEGLENDFQSAIKNLQPKHKDVKFVCLLVKDSTDFKDPTSFSQYLLTLSSLYQELYWLPEGQARKLNIFANPTRIVVGENKTVIHIGFGISMPNSMTEILENELK
jgi:hypothetical protein